MSENPAGSSIRHIRQRIGELGDATAMLPPLSRIVAVLHYNRVAGDEAVTRSNRLVAVGHLVEEHPEYLSNMDTRLIDGPMASRDTLDPYREPQMLCFTNIYGYGEEAVPGRPGWWFRSIGFLPDMPYRIDCTLIYGYSGSGGYWNTQTVEPGIYKWPSDSWKVPNPFHLPAFRMCNDHETDLVFQSADYTRNYGALYVVPDLGVLQKVYKSLKSNFDYLSSQQNTFSRHLTEAKDEIKALTLRVERLETENRLLGYGLSFADARRLAALDLPAAQYDLVPRYMEIGYDMDDIERCLPTEIPDPDAAFAHAKEVLEGWVPGTKLRDDQDLVVAPKLDTAGIKDMSRIFANCNNLRVVPWFDTSQATSLASLFDQCHSLETVPDIDTGAATDMNAMFWNCGKLAHPPRTLDTSGANVRAMFASCEEMTDLPEIDASGTTNISLLCTRCFNLEELSITNMQNVTKALQMLYHCEKLRRISPLDTPVLANMKNMFDGCCLLEAIPLVDMRSATDVGIAFYGLFAATLINAVNLGAQPQQTLLEFHDCQNWGSGDDPENRQSLIDTLLTNSHDRASASMEPCRIRLHSNTRALLTPEEIAAITAKGYTITT